MRAALLGMVAAVALTALPVASQAAPVAPALDTVAPPSGIVQVWGGCGPGWRPVWWRDRWGRPHRRCVPARRRW